MIGAYLASAYDADGSYDCRRGCWVGVGVGFGRLGGWFCWCRDRVIRLRWDILYWMSRLQISHHKILRRSRTYIL